MKYQILFFLIALIAACQEPEVKPINAAAEKGEQFNVPTRVLLPYPDSLFETFEMTEGEVTYIMKKYFIAFLKTGPNRNQSKEEAAKIQSAHLAHLGKLANEKRACMIGPFGQEADSDIQGIVIFSVPDKEEAEKLAAQDPAVKAGRIVIEIQPWWAAKGSKLF
ncbi:MAG: YciI family protein [Bacteroidota bacterium]